MRSPIAFCLMAAWSAALPLTAEEPKALLNVEGALTTASDKEPGFYPHYFKVHTVKLQAGRAYRIDLVSKAFTPSLSVQAAEKSDGPVAGMNPSREDRSATRAICTPSKDGDHAVTVQGGGSETKKGVTTQIGAYTLTVRDITDAEDEVVDFQMGQIFRLTDVERKRVLANLQKRFTAAGAKLTDKDAATAVVVAHNFEYYGQEKDAYESFAKIFAASGSPVGAATAKRLEARGQGRERFLSLPGKTLEFHGTTTDGKAWNLKDQRGKVVVLYFWYAGSGVRDEVKELFDAYQGKLLVVGLNVDKTKAALDRSMKRANSPWPTLNSMDRDEGPTKLFGDLAVTLGGSMPCILVDAEGKVVSTDIGVDFAKSLEKLLGPAPAKK